MLPNRQKILLVEDVEETRTRISSVLGRHGFDVIPAVDGGEGLRRLRQTPQPFSAILLDLVMPGVNGWEFRDTQRRVHEWSRIPTVIVSVHPLTPVERYTLRAAAVLVKPFEDDALVAMVTKVTTPGWLSPIPDASVASDPGLFWSRKGEVACTEHAPSRTSTRWEEERWGPLPQHVMTRLEYQCQHCSGNGPIVRRFRSS
jgi:CheY-like chemotaxis protein